MYRPHVLYPRAVGNRFGEHRGRVVTVVDDHVRPGFEHPGPNRSVASQTPLADRNLTRALFQFAFEQFTRLIARQFIGKFDMPGHLMPG